MSGNRKAAESIIFEYMAKLLPGDDSMKKIYTDLFATMDDKAFEQFINDLESGKSRLAIIAPNLAKVKLSVERNLEIGDELGHNFFQRIWMDPKNGTPTYLTNKAYLVVDLPLRRQAQILEKKISIPKNNKSIDELTGQPSGASKGSKISYPETQIMAALDLPKSQIEMIKFRGGDIDAFNAMNNAIDKYGSVSMASLSHLKSEVESTTTLKIFLRCMMLENTL
jgi:hypothetical protein